MKTISKRLAALEQRHLPDDLEQNLFMFCFADWLCVPPTEKEEFSTDIPSAEEVLRVAYGYRTSTGETTATTIEAFREELIKIMPTSGT